MHEIGAQIFDIHVYFCHLFCHPKLMNVDVAGPLESWSLALHKCHVTQIVLVHTHRTNGISLLLYEILQVESLISGVGKQTSSASVLYLVMIFRLDERAGNTPASPGTMAQSVRDFPLDWCTP